MLHSVPEFSNFNNDSLREESKCLVFKCIACLLTLFLLAPGADFINKYKSIQFCLEPNMREECMSVKER